MNAQVPITDWPTGLCEDALLLRLSPKDIAALTDAVFEESSDDLGKVEIAIVRGERGREIAFQRHMDAPVAGTVVIRHAGDDSSLRWVARQLKLTPEDVIWSAPGIELRVQSKRKDDKVITGIAAVAASALALALTSQKRSARRGTDGRFIKALSAKVRPPKQRA